MDLTPSPRTLALQKTLRAFMDEHIYPNERIYEEQLEKRAGTHWVVPEIFPKLQAKAKDAGLWNLFLTHSKRGPGLTNLEYAPLAEIMGRVHWASEVFNCSAPDTGNMEVGKRFPFIPEHPRQ